MMNYVSLIVDIEKSRMYHIEERNEIQSYMAFCVNQLNDLFHENMECEVTFSAGDELQGLFRDATTAVLYYRLFQLLMSPVRVRAGIGIGEWNVIIRDGSSTQQDGPVYHRARNAITEVYKMQSQNIRICSDYNDILANHLLNASSTLKIQQNYMQNIVNTLIEFMYPIIKLGMELKKEEIIKELIQRKFEFKVNAAGSKHERTNSGKTLGFQIGEIQIESPIFIEPCLIEPEEAIARKNVSSTVSRILGCTRQNVDSIIKRGNINIIREMDFAALQYIENEYGGYRWR